VWDGVSGLERWNIQRGYWANCVLRVVPDLEQFIRVNLQVFASVSSGSSAMPNFSGCIVGGAGSCHPPSSAGRRGPSASGATSMIDVPAGLVAELVYVSGEVLFVDRAEPLTTHVHGSGEAEQNYNP
jgi:hypothetical protein